MSTSESSFEDDEIICDEVGGLLETGELHELSNQLSNINIKDTEIEEPEETVQVLAETVALPNEVDELIAHKELSELLLDLYKSYSSCAAMPDAVSNLVVLKKLNTMVIDLYDYDKGYDVSFCKYGEKEVGHGRYSYAVSLVEYIRDGEIPYEVFDNISKYDFKLFYDGYVACELRIHFRKEDNVRSHFVLLKHSIQTIDAECSMKCKADSSLNFEAERARLIKYYSPDLCLDPDPVVAEIIVSNELNQYPFITPYLTHIIRNEKARREKGVQLMKKPKPQESDMAEHEESNLAEPEESNLAEPEESNLAEPEESNLAEREESAVRKKKENWNFRLTDPTPEERELSGSNLEYNDSIMTYLKNRKICFPDPESFTGFPVEIENFVYEYEGGEDGEESITDKFCIAVRSEKEYYCGALQLNEKEERRKEPSEWWNIGTRQELDIHVNAFTFEEMKLTSGGMKITHNRIFEEEFEYSCEKVRSIRNKLDAPVSRIVMELSPPAHIDQSDDEMDED